MKKLLPFYLVFGALLIFIAGGLSLYFFGPALLQQKQIATRTQTLIHQLKLLQRLEVLQANLLAYKTYQDRSFVINANELVVMARGSAIYGIDFSEPVDVQVTGRSISVTLPPVKLLHVSIEADSIAFIGLKKGWLTSQQQFEELKQEQLRELNRELNVQARDPEMRQKAQENARQLIRSMLYALGFETVSIRFGRGGQP